MKIFGVSFITIIIVLIAYVVGTKYPGPANAVLSKVGM